jgi:DNA-binding XRE family transcriptional regulator
MPKKNTRLKSPVSAALREMRHRAGLSQGDVSQELRIALQTCVLWETKRPPSGIMLVRLSQMADYYKYSDLKQVFEDALAKLPPAVAADIKEERERWRMVEAMLGWIQDKAPDDTDIARYCHDIWELLEEIQAWNWRNQR